MHRLALLFALSLGACGGAPRPQVTTPVRVADARLVVVNPDVKAVADADQPVFLARGSYFLFHDGRWFRGPSATGPWTYDAEPPVPVRQIDQPFAYVHYQKDQPGKAVETVAAGFGPQPQDPEAAPEPDVSRGNERPARDRQPAATDPSVDPTQNL